MDTQQKTGIEYWKKIVIVMCFGWVAIWIYRTVLTPIYPEIQASLGGVSDAEIGAIASFYFLAYCSMQIPCGILVDKLGQKIMLACGFSLFTVGTLCLAQASGLTMIYAGSMMAGAGCASFFCSAYSLSSENVPPVRRALANAIINSGSALGMGIGLIGSSILVKNMNMEWQTVLMIIAGILVVMIGVFLLTIRSKAQKEQVQDADARAANKVNIDEKPSPLFSPLLCSSYFLYFCTCYGYYLIVTWLPSYLQAERGFEGIAIGFAAALVALAGIPGALIFSNMSDQFHESKSRVKLLLVLGLLSALMLLLTVMAPNSTVLMISLILYGLLGKLAVDPILISYVSEQASSQSLGRTFSLLNFFGMSSAIIAPTLTGFISDVTGSKEISFVMSAILMVIGTIIFALVTARSKSPDTAMA
ncbi:MFS transporter [Photobacterium nomapromontoriensis]|uniref:MFS transporter n=1 Tax=Photobacterium nomapromontoriensis TaxID=2910237 RepID=UPI003D1080BA